MLLVLYKDKTIVKSFEDCNNPFTDILGFTFDGESQMFTVRFADESHNGEPQSFAAQFGVDFDGCHVGTRTR